MKKLIFLFTLVVLALSCTKTEDDLRSSETGGDYYSLDGSKEGGDTGSTGTGGSDGDTIQSGQLTAGEWNDLDNWEFWSNLGQDEDYAKMPGYWDFNLEGRISVEVRNTSEQSIPDMQVELLNSTGDVLWTAKTDNKGRAELWPYLGSDLSISSANLTLRIDGTVFTNVRLYSEGTNTIIINHELSTLNTANVAFVVDATGSMGDELEYLKVELIDVIGRVKSANPGVSLNLGSVFYRDTEDEYVTKTSDFSPDIDKTVDFIRAQSANGGGDFPEAVHTALDKALHNLQWSDKARARLLFLVLDAPPHYEPSIVSEINNHIRDAAEYGIKIIPVVASGIDKETEFLMRYMAIASNGTYVFITGDSGIGGEHLIPTVGDYEVEFLNDLIERLINSNLD